MGNENSTPVTRRTSAFSRAMGRDSIVPDGERSTARKSSYKQLAPTRSARVLSNSSIISSEDGSQDRRPSTSRRTVAMLRPSKALTIDQNTSVTEASSLMAAQRVDAAIITQGEGSEGDLKGIITDKDIVYRVIAADLDPQSTNVSSIMTSNPRCVSRSASATDALKTMVDGRFRHLPVVDHGIVVGVLDITKCLFDAILKVEQMLESSAASLQEVVDKVKKSNDNVKHEGKCKNKERITSICILLVVCFVFAFLLFILKKIVALTFDKSSTLILLRPPPLASLLFHSFLPFSPLFIYYS